MTTEWQNVLRDHWNIMAQLTPLAGEYDLNFLAQTDADQDYVLKVMRPDVWSIWLSQDCSIAQRSRLVRQRWPH